jgi:hypothetical protein
MSDNPSAPFGHNTIEGAFLNDVEYGFDSDTKEVTVQAEDRDEHEIGMCNVELEQKQVGTQEMHGQMYPVAEILYQLTVPVELAVRSGDDVHVYGYEAAWVFEDVDVISVNATSTTVLSERIARDYGDTSQPDDERFE